MQLKNAIAIVHVMAGMHKFMCIIWNTNVGRTLKYNKRYFQCKHTHSTDSSEHVYRISSKRRRGYYLFQLYRNAATIRGWLLFKVQTSRLLFISALPQCSDYSRVATIRSTDAAATIYFSSTAMRRLFEGGYYSKYRRRGYYLFQLYRNAATIQGRLLFEVQTSRLLFISALPQCGDYSRVATIRSKDAAATIYFSATAMRRLLEGGYYSKYRHRGHYLFQRYHNAATIRGRLLFEVRCLFKEIRNILPFTAGRVFTTWLNVDTSGLPRFQYYKVEIFGSVIFLGTSVGKDFT